MGANESSTKKKKKSVVDLTQPSKETTDPSLRFTIDDFDLLAVVGKGSFGKVMQVRKKDSGEIFAMKILRKDQLLKRDQIMNTQLERSILQKTNHPFLVGLKFAFQTDDKLYMVMDYAAGGELFHHLQQERRFSEDRVRLYAAEIVLGLGFLHSQGIVYRDLKPENLLLSESGHIMLTDFGMCKQLLEASSKAHTFCGSPEYIAPEILRNEGYTKAVDWWSLGTMIFEMLSGLPPFYSENVNTMYEKILRQDLKFPPHFTPEAKRLITGLLMRDPKKRLGSSSADYQAIQKEPFFAPLDWKKVLAREYTPKFKPKVASPGDISNFDPEFTRERPVDSVVDSTLSETARRKTAFAGFTYTASPLVESEE